MSLKRNSPPMAAERYIRPRLPPQVSIITFLRATSFHLPRRRKRSGYLSCSNHQLTSSSYSSSSQDSLFHALLSQLDLLAPALGFTTALAILYKSTSNSYISPVTGYWTLFTSPTPFNRFIKLRCASLQSEEEEEEGSKLVEEGGHLVSFDTGRIPHVNDYTATHELPTYSYQRICINTDDGGVVSLDWPANLELTKEHGLDTTIFIVPGTTAGSMDENVKSFAYECLNRGCFPIVMNPRGCARSPLTTPRLFTAADSDDVCTAVQFINGSRPWTTLMGVGMGYGANMLTKYLAQVGEETPLTAATCLDNPFDLNGAATAGSPSYLYVDQNLTDGLIEVLKSNKELFQGRSKGFDVDKALQAKSLKDFEEAISMVSNGFDSIEEFYISSSTRDLVGNVKIPLLFLQNNAMPSSSIPHSLIAENPFTSLLMCTFQSDDRNTSGTSAVSWCQHLVIEWLTAVELALLKGRHPLLEDTDATSKRLTSQASSRSSNHMNFEQLNRNNSYPWKKMKTSSDIEYVRSTSGLDLQMSKAKHKDTNAMVNTQTKLVVDELELVKKEDDVIDSERGKVIQATQVVMNMLDVTMPEALSEEQKHKVLTAVGQGETLINAFQGAVPEDVRGKLTTSLTTILQNQKKNLNGLSSITPDVTLAAANTKMQKVPGQELDSNNASELNTEVVSNYHPNKNDASQPEAHTLGNSDGSNQGGREIPNSGTTGYDQSRSDDFSEEKAAQSHDLDSSTSTNKVERSEHHISEQVEMGHEGGTNDDQQKQSKDALIISEQVKTGHEGQKSVSSTLSTEETSPSSPENQLIMANEDGENQKKAQPVPSNSSSSSPSFSVSQALEALTGMDDSTQVAVNSVFSVIEDVITQLEGNGDNESAIDDAADDDKNKVEGISESESGLPQKGDGKNDMTNERIKELGNHHQQSMSLSTQKKDEATTGVVDNSDDIRHSITNLPYRNSLYDKYVQSHLLSKMKNDKLCGSDDAASLYLDYVPEEGQWKLLEQSGDRRNDDDVTSHQGIDINVECNNDIIEPAYVILDAEDDWDPVRQYKKNGQTKGKLEIGDGDASSLQLMQLVKENILNSLQFEVSRKIQAMDMVDIAPMLRKELEHVANTISWTVVHEKHVISWDGEKLGNLQCEHILDAISSAIRGTRYMKEVIPVGIVVDCSLASVRKIFNINAADSIESSEAVRDETSKSRKGYQRLQADSNRMAADEIPLINKLNNTSSSSNNFLYNEDEERDESSSLRNDTVMVGAVTAALGASALLVQQQQHSHGDGHESCTTSSMSFNKKEKGHKQPEKPEEETSRSDDNIVTSLAEKAMLVAGPVVPTTEDGGVDQDRLVALLADLGQKGGILKLIGKVALLWGGIRGALSLTGKLISFLRLAERPLIQRILGFVFMVLVLWTPIVVPLLPTLVKNWAAHNSSKYAELACMIGLYSSIMILVVLWGKRIRGYEDPFERYGLQLTSARQILNCVCGLIGGAMLVFFIQYTNAMLGFVCLSWPSTIPSSTDAVTLLKLFGKVLIFVVQGLVTTVSVALVQELLFRSWLPEEIAVDLGYSQGVILSGLAFSLSQWSLKAIPGLWLLSVGLAGVRERCKGSLFLPIGLNAGIVASSFFLKEGGFLIYQPTNYPLLVSGGGEPFNSVVGLAVALLWAAILYPRKPQNAEKQ